MTNEKSHLENELNEEKSKTNTNSIIVNN